MVDSVSVKKKSDISNKKHAKSTDISKVAVTNFKSKNINNKDYAKGLKNNVKYARVESLNSQLTHIKNVKSLASIKAKTKEQNCDIQNELDYLLTNYVSSRTLLVRLSENWRSQVVSESIEDKPMPFALRKRLRALAKMIYDDEVKNYKIYTNQGSSFGKNNILRTILSGGTDRDIIAALSTKCTESPVHTIWELQKLISYLKKIHSEKAFGNVFEMFQRIYLIDSYLVKEFECHSFTTLIPFKSSPEMAHKQLLLWYFEDQFRLAYHTLIENLTEMSNNTVYKVKFLAIQQLSKLLIAFPYQEFELILSNMVNKLGDQLVKICGTTINRLRAIEVECPQHKFLLVSLVDQLLHREHASDKAKYYALCLLTVTEFSREEFNLAARVIKIYFAFFKSCTAKGTVNSSYMGCILRGVNRAYPYIDQIESPEFSQQVSTLYTVCHLVNFKIGIQTLRLIFQVIGHSPDDANRFYQVLYKFLLNPLLGTTVSSNSTLELIYTAMIGDPEPVRVRAFLKRMLQIGFYQAPHTTSGIMMVVSKIICVNPKFRSVRKALLQDFSVQDQEQNDVPVQTKKIHEECESETLGPKNRRVRKLEIYQRSKKYLRNMRKKEENIRKKEERENECPIIPVASKPRGDIRITTYDPSNRNPLYCGAEFSQMWELARYSIHNHPTIHLFASMLMKGEPLQYPGDPLIDLTIMRFADRFVYRNPKKPNQQNRNLFAVKTEYVPEGAKKFSIDSSEFKNMSKNQVTVDDHFMHKFFKNRIPRARKEKDPIDDINEDDDAFEDAMRSMNLGQYVGDVDELQFVRDLSATDGTEGGDDKDNAESADIDMGDEDFDDEGFDNEDFDDEDLELEGGDDGDIDDDSKQMNGFGNSQLKDHECRSSDDGGSDFEAELDDFIDEPSLEKEKRKSKKKNRSEADEEDDLLLSGDDFTQMLEDVAGQREYMEGTTKAVLNRDNSSMAQLRWEENKYSDLDGGNERTFKKGNSRFKGGKNFSQKFGKRQNFGKPNTGFPGRNKSAQGGRVREGGNKTFKAKHKKFK